MFSSDMKENMPNFIILFVALFGVWFVYSNAFTGKNAAISMSRMEPASGGVMKTIDYNTFEPVSGVVPPQPQASGMTTIDIKKPAVKAVNESVVVE